MRHICVYIFLLLNGFHLYSQKEANVWYFGSGAGVDFNSGAPVAVTDGQSFSEEACGSICDDFGNILLYSDGNIVWNAWHRVLKNGSDLWGHRSSAQSGLLIR